MNEALSEGSGAKANLAGENEDQRGFWGPTTMLRRLTILCLMIAGCAAVASIFVDQKYNVYRDQAVIGSLAAYTQEHGGTKP